MYVKHQHVILGASPILPKGHFQPISQKCVFCRGLDSGLKGLLGVSLLKKNKQTNKQTNKNKTKQKTKTNKQTKTKQNIKNIKPDYWSDFITGIFKTCK